MCLCDVDSVCVKTHAVFTYLYGVGAVVTIGGGSGCFSFGSHFNEFNMMLTVNVTS